MWINKAIKMCRNINLKSVTLKTLKSLVQNPLLSCNFLFEFLIKEATQKKQVQAYAIAPAPATASIRSRIRSGLGIVCLALLRVFNFARFACSNWKPRRVLGLCTLPGCVCVYARVWACVCLSCVCLNIYTLLAPHPLQSTSNFLFPLRLLYL